MSSSVISPVTLAPTADEFTVPSASYATTPLNAPDGATVYASVWIFIAGDGTRSCVFGFLRRDGTASESTFVLTLGAWHRLTHEGPIGVGTTTPLLRLKVSGAPVLARLSWAVAGVRDTDLESQILRAFPLHTHCHFGVIGEYETLLSHDPLAVGW